MKRKTFLEDEKNQESIDKIATLEKQLAELKAAFSSKTDSSDKESVISRGINEKDNVMKKRFMRSDQLKENNPRNIANIKIKISEESEEEKYDEENNNIFSELENIDMTNIKCQQIHEKYGKKYFYRYSSKKNKTAYYKCCFSKSL